MSYDLEYVVLDTTDIITRFENALTIPLSQANLKELLCQLLDCAGEDLDNYHLLAQSVPIYNRMYLIDYDQAAQANLYQATQQLARELYQTFTQLKTVRLEAGRAVLPFGFKTLLMKNVVLLPLYS